MSAGKESVVAYSGYVPGALGTVCAMQSRYYAREWDFGRAFETKVAAEMAEFLARLDPALDFFEIAMLDGDIVGSITLDGGEHGDGTAHLRWFCVADGVQGRGIGAALMRHAMDFAAAARFSHIYLWTFEGLDPARTLYERAGFAQTEAHPGETWGKRVVEQKFEKSL